MDRRMDKVGLALYSAADSIQIIWIDVGEKRSNIVQKTAYPPFMSVQRYTVPGDKLLERSRGINAMPMQSRLNTVH